MDLNPLSAILSIGEAAIQRIWPDPVKQAEEQRKLAQLAQEGDLARLQAHVQLLVGQLEINKQEAQHKSLFVAGWRPWIGWVGGIALAYQFVLYPLLLWVWAILAPVGMEAPAALDTSALWPLLTGMLGIGGLRSFDKMKGTQTDRLKPS
jgi:hypothetical protein